MKKLLIIFVLLIMQNVSAQVETSNINNSYSFVPAFYVDFINYKDYAENKTRTDIFVQVPYSTITFAKDQNKYSAKYAITLRVFDDDDKPVDEFYWNERFSVEDFNQTSSKKSSNLSHKFIVLKEGKYTYKCFLEDKQSKRTLRSEGAFSVNGLLDSVSASGIMLIDKYLKTDVGSRILPNVSKLIYIDSKFLSFFFEVYSDKPRKIKLVYELRDGSKTASLLSSDFVNLNKGKNRLNKSFELLNPLLGKINLVINVEDSEGNLVAKSSKNFIGLLRGFPVNAIVDLDLAIDQLLYIANPGQISEIENTSIYKEKIQKFIDFWKRIDPTPRTPENESLAEYYRRVNYANKNFGSYFKGWKTDMGMIYITLGPPNQVERRPFESDSKPYEIWYYFGVNKQFTFVDNTGFGDYRLINPQYGEWFRFTY